MGLFGSLLGFDQTMGASNAVGASYLIEAASPADRMRIAKDVAGNIMRVQRKSLAEALQEISKQSRIIQMNFIALSCINLNIDYPFSGMWVSVKNPYLFGSDSFYRISDKYIDGNIYITEKNDHIRVVWPGNDVRIDFKKMLDEGILY